MKNFIRKFWGVGLIIILLSSMFVGSVPQASAGNYVMSADLSVPYNGGALMPLNMATFLPETGFGQNDVAQSGAVIYTVCSDATIPLSSLYKSVNGGASWFPCNALGIPNTGADVWKYVAVAPDDPNVVAIVDFDTTAFYGGDLVFLSTNGGASFECLSPTPPPVYTPPVLGGIIDTVAISYLTGPFRYVAIGGGTGAPAGGFVLDWWHGLLAPSWNLPVVVPPGVAMNVCDNVLALTYSPSFPSDSALIGVDFTAAPGAPLLEVQAYSYNLYGWNFTGTYFPKILNASPSLALCLRASIALDSNFYLGDPALQIGFVGAELTDPAGTNAEVGGVFRIDTMTQIFGGYTTSPLINTAINSVAWDGTNLMAGSFTATPIVVYRCSNALAPAGFMFLPNSAVKTPGTGISPLVIFNASSGYGYCFSLGPNSGVARTTDYGKSFNGIALINSSFANVIDYWTSADGARVYALTDDGPGLDVNLWRKSGFTWERIFIDAAGSGNKWLVRAAKSNPDDVYLGLQTVTTMWKSLDAGEHVWTPRACSWFIQDFVVQDASTLYVATTNPAATVVKSTNGAFAWTPVPVPTGLASLPFPNVNYSITLIANDQIVVGGSLGGVAYSADGNATWTVLPAFVGAFPYAPVITAASGLAVGNTIWAADTAGAIDSWTIGTNNYLTGWTPGFAGTSITGLVYSNTVLYAMDENVAAPPHIIRFLYPTIAPVFALGPTDIVPLFLVPGDTYFAPDTINSLQVTTAGTANTLYVRDALAVPAAGRLSSYTDYLTTAAAAPVPTYPVNDSIIPVNSLNGFVNNFIFKWAAPAVVSTPVFYTFDIAIYTDAAATILVGFDSGIIGGTGVVGAFGGGTGSEPTAAGALAFTPVAGTTYYWQVRVSSHNIVPLTTQNPAVQSYWSPMMRFTIQEMQAIVPVIASPVNGTTVDSINPAFSWTPLSGASMYYFELSKTADFSTLVYSANVSTSGVADPTPLVRGTQYFWRVKAIAPIVGEFSTVANFTVGELPAEPAPPIIITNTPAPTIVISQPPAVTTQVVVTQAAEKVINPTYIWAIIIIGAILVVAVIILIVRTRRSV